MNNFRTSLLALAACAAWVPSLALGARHALLIGVAEYQDPESSLNFPEKDVAAFQSYLIREHGFEDGEISTLLSSEATAKGIREAIDNLVTRAGADDAVVIYYSGHGSRVIDEDGDELDGFDETLCPHDFDNRNPATHYTDDHFRAALSSLKTSRCLVVLDCCHSGTGTRTGGAPAKKGIKMIPSPFHPGPPQAVRGRAGSPMKSLVKSDSGMRHLLIAGCAADEVSYESGRLGGGLVTQALVKHGTGAQAQEPLGSLSMTVRKQALEWCAEFLPGEAPQNVQFEGMMKGSLRELLAKAPPKIEVVTPPSTELTADQAREVMLTLSTDKPVYRAGEKAVVTVRADRDCHLRLYYTDGDGKSFLVYPNKFQKDDRIKGSEPVLLGGSGAPFAFQLTFPESFDGKEVGEVLTAVASPQPFADEIGNWGESSFEEIKGVGRGSLLTRGVRIQQRPGIAVTSYRIER